VVATFVPDNAERALEMFIDGRDVALVREGAPVRIQFEGWPVIQVSGWPSVAVGTFSGHVIAIDPRRRPTAASGYWSRRTRRPGALAGPPLRAFRVQGARLGAAGGPCPSATRSGAS
jgi:hypothetical protein